MLSSLRKQITRLKTNLNDLLPPSPHRAPLTVLSMITLSLAACGEFPHIPGVPAFVF
jgi:hypothetical protein